MKTYLLQLKPKSGLLSDLQSDTIYGHFCWRLKEKSGDKKLSEFISLYKTGNPVFLLSDGFLQVNNELRFPRPFIFNKPEAKESKAEKILEFVNRKKNKERNYLTIEELNEFLKTGRVQIKETSQDNSDQKHHKLKRPITAESLRVSVQIDRSTFGSSEGRLFSYNPRYTREDVSYVVLIKVLEESKFDSFQCEKVLKDTFYVGFGKKKSSGYGQFEVGELKEYNNFNEPQGANGIMVFGNYLPAPYDQIEPIGYDINTKYGKLGEELSQSENPFKNPISFLTAGSCFKTETQNDYYGRITSEGEVSNSNPFVVQFGMPFILKTIII